MKIALISLSNEGAQVLQPLLEHFPESCLFVHNSVTCAGVAQKFAKISILTKKIFGQYDGLVYAAPCGIVVRAVGPVMQNKHIDPAVVVVDIGGRHAVSLIGGHEGGANDLAVAVSNIIGAEPVITTTTESLKTIIVGVGCRRGTKRQAIVEAVRSALAEAKIEINQVRFIASADIKASEEGLLTAAAELGIPIRFIKGEDIRRSRRNFEHSNFVQKKVNLPAVAEPAALLAGRRTQLIRPRKSYNGVMIAIAKENFSWSVSDPAGH
jgi:cobalt-precorrin 5A hydrolase